jgi:[ribosomal protein S18]-alanine N-acetyltransferase
MTAIETASLRPMRWWDVDAVLKLEDELFADDAWTAGMFWSELAQPDSRYYVVVVDAGDIVGYAGLAALGDEGYVQTLGVTTSYWGRGFGAALLTAVLTEAERRHVGALVLEVRADNDRAQGLYERFGFERVGLRKGYYQPSGADAVVMVRRSP